MIDIVPNGVAITDTAEVALSGVVHRDGPASSAPSAPRAQAPRFRSTAAFAMRSRAQTPAIERATFVTFSIGGRRFAAAVEAVERVLRIPGCDGASPEFVEYAAREVPLADLAGAIGEQSPQTALTRVLVVTVPGGWIGVPVDQVHEIATVDASAIMPVVQEDAAAAIPGVRGRFVRHDKDVLVVDIARALGFRHGC